MKNLQFWTVIVLVGIGVVLAGCSGGGSTGNTQDEIAKINKNLPASDPNPPAPPTREDGKGTKPGP